MKKSIIVLFVTIVSMVLGYSDKAHSATQFVISPPPIASPSFEKGKSNSRADVSFVSLSTDTFSALGAGVDFKTRKPFSDLFAMDFQGGVFFLSGESDASSDMTMTMLNVPASVNLECQPVKTDSFNTILFGGLVASVSTTYIEVNEVSVGSSNVLAGYQLGIQLGFFSQNYVISPFAFTLSQSGTGETDGVTFDIDEYTSNSVGLDIMHKSSGITLSSIMNFISQTSDDKDEEDVDIFILKIGKSF